MKKISTKQKLTLIIFGVFLSIVLLEIGLCIAGFAFLSVQECRNIGSLKQKGRYRILCLGESTTFLQYPSHLEEVLNEKVPGIKFTVIDKGMPATNSTAIVSNIEEYLDKYNPDIVITMTGINDGGMDNIICKDAFTGRIIQFLNSFRTYKLIKLLKLHIVNKVREIKAVKPGEKENVAATAGYLTGRGQENLYKKKIEIDPDNYQAYVDLGQYYREQGRYEEAEKTLKKAIEINPGDANAYIAYVVLGECYRLQGRYKEAEERLKKAIEINPIRNNEFRDNAYIVLRDCYRHQGRVKEGDDMLIKAIEINPKASFAYVILGESYIHEGRYKEAEELLKEAIEINPKAGSVYLILGEGYIVQGRYKEAEKTLERTLKNAIEIGLRSDRSYRSLALSYELQGKHKLAKEYFIKANRLRYYNPVTQQNYQKLVRIVTQRGIRLICVQYPLRSVKPLKKMLEPYGDIIFVDNEKVFKDVLKHASYGEYFKDNFAGDFGHCTSRGNKLLAENIANAILKGCFNK